MLPLGVPAFASPGALGLRARGARLRRACPPRARLAGASCARRDACGCRGPDPAGLRRRGRARVGAAVARRGQAAGCARRRSAGRRARSCSPPTSRSSERSARARWCPTCARAVRAGACPSTRSRTTRCSRRRRAYSCSCWYAPRSPWPLRPRAPSRDDGAWRSRSRWRVLSIALVPYALSRLDYTHAVMPLSPRSRRSSPSRRWTRAPRRATRRGAGHRGRARHRRPARGAALLRVVRAQHANRLLGRSPGADWVPAGVGGRTFGLPSDLAHDVQRVVDAAERERRRGARTFFTGPRDLRRGWQNDAFLYFVLADLRPASQYLEINPWTANAPGSGLAGRIASRRRPDPQQLLGRLRRAQRVRAVRLGRAESRRARALLPGRAGGDSCTAAPMSMNSPCDDPRSPDRCCSPSRWRSRARRLPRPPRRASRRTSPGASARRRRRRRRR